MKSNEEKDTLIHIKDLVQRLGRQTILNGIDLDLYRGECLGVFGFRGSGKTVLLHVVAGVERFSSGTVEILGERVGKSEAYKGKMGLVTQQPSLFSDLNVMENLDLFCAIKRVSREQIQASISRLELEAYLQEPISRLNVGVFQRLALGCALLNNPEILIIDEIIRDIDLQSRIIILKVLEEHLKQGNSCLWSSSNIEYVHYMDRVAWLQDATINMYTPDEVEHLWQEKQAMIPRKRGERNV